MIEIKNWILISVTVVIVLVVAYLFRKQEDQEKKIEELLEKNNQLMAENISLETNRLKLILQPHTLNNILAQLKVFSKKDVIITYYLYENLGNVVNPDYYWVALPFKEEAYGINWFDEFASDDGFIFVNAEKTNGSSPFTTTVTNGFKSVLIKANGLKAHPDLDLSNYQEDSVLENKFFFKYFYVNLFFMAAQS